MSGNRLAVPAYFHPAPGDWAALAGTAVRLRAVVLNVDSGPGRGPSAEFLLVARRLAASGVNLLGYVDTGYGERPVRLVHADIARFRRWYPVTGVFLDRASAGPSGLAWYERLVARARMAGATTVVLNHGVCPDRRYAELADTLVTFEGAWPAYRRWRAPGWVGDYHADRFWHLVYATPGHALAAALRHAAACHVATVYVTERTGDNPWDGLPSYFDRQARRWASR
jgi:hypothetical protein